MIFQISGKVSILLTILFTKAYCRPVDEGNVLTKIFPFKTVHHELPSGDRMIPVRVIHLKNIAIAPEANGSQQSSLDQDQETQASSLMVTRGFKDDFDMKSNKRSLLQAKLETQVPIIPKNVSTPKWVPGELIVSEITRRQVKMIDQSQFGPIRTVTFIPSVQAGIIVFEKRYNPEKLSLALKYLFGIESEPNGVITTTA